MAVALFWFAMRVIWSGISKVISEAAGEKTPSELMLNLPLYINVFLWLIFAFALISLVWLSHKKWPQVTLTALLVVFTVASAAVVVMGAIDYLYFIWPKFFLSMAIGLALLTFAMLVFYGNGTKGKCYTALKCTLVSLLALICIFRGYGVTIGSRFTYEPVVSKTIVSSFLVMWYHIAHHLRRAYRWNRPRGVEARSGTAPEYDANESQRHGSATDPVKCRKTFL